MMEKLSLVFKKMVLLSLCPLIFLESCTPNSSPPNFRDSAFCADLVYVTETTHICATVQAEVPRAPEDTLPRDVKLVFSHPKALQGLTLTRRNGTVSFEYMGIITTSDHTDLLRPVALLLGEDPNTTEDQSYEIHLSPNTGFPEEILTSEETLQISNFQKISSDE